MHMFFIMAYFHVLMVMLGEEVWNVVWGEGGHYSIISFSPNFSKYSILYVQNILYGGIILCQIFYIREG